MNFLAPYANHLLSVLRVMSGLLFLQYGMSKILGFPESQHSGVNIMSLGGAAGMIELIGGTLLVIGLFTRPVAFICSGTMAAAYFIAHAGQSFFPILNGGGFAILFCFTFLYLAAAGGGKWSVDAMRSNAG